MPRCGIVGCGFADSVIRIECRAGSDGKMWCLWHVEPEASSPVRPKKRRVSGSGQSVKCGSAGALPGVRLPCATCNCCIGVLLDCSQGVLLQGVLLGCKQGLLQQGVPWVAGRVSCCPGVLLLQQGIYRAAGGVFCFSAAQGSCCCTWGVNGLQVGLFATQVLLLQGILLGCSQGLLW